MGLALKHSSSSEAGVGRRSVAPPAMAPFLLLLLLTASVRAPLAGQATGRVLGLVLDAENGQPVAGAQASIVGHPLRTITNEAGRFVLTAVPPGPQSIRVEMIGYRGTTLDDVQVRAGHPVEVQVRLGAMPVEMEGLVVEARMPREGQAPSGTYEPAPVLPGQSWELVATAEPGHRLHLAWMYAESNDVQTGDYHSAIHATTATKTMVPGQGSHCSGKP